MPETYRTLREKINQLIDFDDCPHYYQGDWALGDKDLKLKYFKIIMTTEKEKN